MYVCYAHLSRKIVIITSSVVFENTRNGAIGKTVSTRGEKASDPGQRLTSNFSVDYVIKIYRTWLYRGRVIEKSTILSTRNRYFAEVHDYFSHNIYVLTKSDQLGKKKLNLKS